MLEPTQEGLTPNVLSHSYRPLYRSNGGEGVWFVLVENPSHASIPPIRMARWPKAPVELGNCIGAEDVRSIS